MTLKTGQKSLLFKEKVEFKFEELFFALQIYFSKNG